MRLTAMIGLASSSVLTACGSSVQIANADSHLAAKGFTHSATTEVWLGAWGNPSAGRNKVLSKAVKTCGLPRSTAPDDIRLSEGGGLYGYRFFAFSCPAQGKDAK